MGRTVLPYSQVWEAERQRWQKFRRALRREDQVHLDRLFESARLHLQAGVYASNPWPLESLLLSMLLEHQKALSALEEQLKRLEQLLRSWARELRRRAPALPADTPPNHCRGGPALSATCLSTVGAVAPPLHNLKGLGRGFGRGRGFRPLPPPPIHLSHQIP